MGEKEIMVSTPFPTDYKEDEEALETSFQALEIIGIIDVEIGRGDIKPSKAAIMVAKVLIANGFVLGKGLGRRLDGMANPVASGRKVQSKQQARPNLYYHFISGGIVTLGHIATVDDQPRESAEWVYPMNEIQTQDVKSMNPSSTTIAMVDGNGSPLLDKTLRIRFKRWDTGWGSELSNHKEKRRSGEWFRQCKEYPQGNLGRTKAKFQQKLNLAGLSRSRSESVRDGVGFGTDSA
ncbi:hypothetical protein CR513_32571, partial [Mucuna pruriens]